MNRIASIGLIAAITYAVTFPFVYAAFGATPETFDPNKYTCVATFEQHEATFAAPERAVMQISKKHVLEGNDAASMLNKINEEFSTNFPLADRIVVWSSPVLDTDYFTVGFASQSCVIYAAEIDRATVNRLFQTL